MTGNQPQKPVVWVGSAKKDFSRFPAEVQREMGFALYVAQTGRRYRSTKILKGLPSGILEIVETFHGDAFRTIYTIRFESAVFVLHAFQKKSKSGISTPKFEMKLVQQRLREAELIEKERQE